MKNEDIEKILNNMATKDIPPEIHAITDESSRAFGKAVQLLASERNRRIERFNWLLDSFKKAAAGAVAVAAVIMLLFWFTRTGEAIAWGDVVAAMQKVSQVHMDAFIRDADDADQINIELYYKRPDMWRGHGFGIVQFIRQEQTKLFDTKANSFVDADKVRQTPVPQEFIDKIAESKTFLDGILSTIFRGRIPTAEPVTAPAGVGSEDIEVFDYVQDPMQVWARVWVLKESRLPVRMKLYQPGQNETILVVFDYNNQQPDEFFDPHKFFEQAKRIYDDKPYKFYRVGLQPIESRPGDRTTAKPKNATQIYELQGYKPPEFIKIEASDNGTILIVADDPKNKTPQGGHAEGSYFEEIRDNWGNLYVRYELMNGFRGGKTIPPGNTKPLWQYYAPVPPIKQGSGEHTITVQYLVWEPANPKGEGPIIVEQKKLKVPDEKVHGIPDDWFDDGDLRNGFEEHRQGSYLTTCATLLDRLEHVEKMFAEDPDSDYLIIRKISLLKQLGDAEDAHAIFAKHLLEEAIAKPFRNFSRDDGLFDYLKWLYKKGDIARVWQIVDKVEEAANAALKGSDRNLSMRVHSRMQRRQLTAFLKARDGLKELAKKPQPKLVEAAQSKDGWLYMVIEAPEYAKQVDNSGTRKWAPNALISWPGVGTDSPWEVVSDREKDGRLLMRLKGDGDNITLTFYPVVVDEKRRSDALRLPWPVTFKLPGHTVETQSDLDEQFADWRRPRQLRAPTKATTKKETEYDKIMTMAYDAYDVGQYEQAITFFEKALELPQSQWPRMHKKDDLDTYSKQQERFFTELIIARNLARLKRYDQVDALFEKIEGQLHDGDTFDKLMPDVRSNMALYRRAEIAKEMIEAGDLDQAEQMLNTIEKSRPDFRRFENMRVSRKELTGIRGFNPRQSAIRTWNQVDIAWWKIKNARKQQKK